MRTTYWNEIVKLPRHASKLLIFEVVLAVIEKPLVHRQHVLQRRLQVSFQCLDALVKNGEEGDQALQGLLGHVVRRRQVVLAVFLEEGVNRVELTREGAQHVQVGAPPDLLKRTENVIE